MEMKILLSGIGVVGIALLMIIPGIIMKMAGSSITGEAVTENEVGTKQTTILVLALDVMVSMSLIILVTGLLIIFWGVMVPGR